MDRSAERARAGGEPGLDPRYDPIYQRGYTQDGEPRASARPVSRASDGSADRPAARPAERAPERAARPVRRTPPSEVSAVPIDGTAGSPVEREDLLNDPQSSDLAEDAPPPAPRRWAVLLAVAGLVLIVLGTWAYMTSWPLQFQGWSVVNDQVRTPDDLSMTQVLMSQLAMAIAPQMIVLGVTAILADLAILAYGSATRARR